MPYTDKRGRVCETYEGHELRVDKAKKIVSVQILGVPSYITIKTFSFVDSPSEAIGNAKNFIDGLKAENMYGRSPKR